LRAERGALKWKGLKLTVRWERIRCKRENGKKEKEREGSAGNASETTRRGKFFWGRGGE